MSERVERRRRGSLAAEDAAFEDLLNLMDEEHEEEQGARGQPAGSWSTREEDGFAEPIHARPDAPGTSGRASGAVLLQERPRKPQE